jgi:hypothetical protein
MEKKMSIKIKMVLTTSISLILCASFLFIANLLIANHSMKHIVETNLNNMVHIVIALIQEQKTLDTKELETIFNKKNP